MALIILESIKLYRNILILLLIYANCSFLFGQNIDSIDVESYKLTVDLTQFKAKRLSGIAEIKCKPLNGVNVKTMRFRLLKLKVDSIFFKAGDSLNFTKAAFTYNDTFISIKQSLTGNSHVKIYYNGSPIKDVKWGGFYFNGDYSFNMGVGFVSNPHNYGRVWFPCIDNFVDRARYSYSIKVQKGFAAICGGSFQDTISNMDNTVNWNWEQSYPIPTYLASVAVAPYKIVWDNYNNTIRNIPITLAAEAKDTSNLKVSFTNLKKAMDVFETFYGPYQFERIGYSLVPFDAGAMEHACNIAYPKYAANGSLTYETLMAHELSHHWWGNNVTCYTAGDMWLNEGWACYSEALFVEKVYGKKAYHDYINKIHLQVLQFAHLLDATACAVNNVSHNNTYGTHVYKKGADMVHSIRGVMGDESFKEKCTTLMSSKKGGNINTKDLIDHFNFKTNLPDNYIHQLISDTGFCHFSIYNYNSVKGSNWETILNYKQRQRLGNHIYKDMPYEVFVFDKNFNKQIFKVNLGVPKPITLSTAFKPEFICFDFDQKFSDAVTDDVILTAEPADHILMNGLMTISISALTDTSLIRVEHNWVHPDNYFMPNSNVILSNERYWTVDGIFDPSLKMSADIKYDGSVSSSFTSGWLDNLLLNGRSEDSLVLLHRANAYSYWQLENNIVKTLGLKNDKKGSFRINELKKGEYAFGIKGKAAVNSAYPVELKKKINVFPNPSQEDITIECNSNRAVTSIQISNLTGQTLVNCPCLDGCVTETIDIRSLPNGAYILTLYSGFSKMAASEFIISR